MPSHADIVTVSPSAAFFVAIGAYMLASLFYLGSFFSAPDWVGRVARWLLILAFVAHGTDISLRGVQHVHPGTSVREALGFLSWIMTGSYLFLSRRAGMAVVGAFLAPVALIVLAAARLSPSGEPVPGLGTVGRFHIALATIGVAIFALATAISVVYLVQERNLKSKNFDGVLFNQSAALETLDRIAHRLVVIGFPIFTVAMMLGAFWASQREDGFNRIEYPIAVITWIAFGSLIAGRTVHGWRGRRAAVTTIVGFVAAVLVLGIYLARRAMT